MTVRIESETTEPYFIVAERCGYTVYEPKVVQSGKTKGVEKDEIVGYYTSLMACVKKIAKCLAEDRFRNQSMDVLKYARELAKIEQGIVVDKTIAGATV